MTEHEPLYCTFRCDDKLFGVSILDVKEVTTETKVTEIPHAPKEVLGYVNIRGHIFLALDLRTLLSMNFHHTSALSRFVIFKNQIGPSFGIMVDEIGDIVNATASQTESFQTANGVSNSAAYGQRSHLVKKAVKLRDELLMVLDPTKFLEVVELALSQYTLRVK